MPPGEVEQIEQIVEIHLSVTDPGEKPVVHRGQHMKGHGVVRAEFSVLPDLPPALRHGVLARQQRVDALDRQSEVPSRPLVVNG